MMTVRRSQLMIALALMGGAALLATPGREAARPASAAGALAGASAASAWSATQLA